MRQGTEQPRGHTNTSTCTQHPAGPRDPGLVQSREVVMQQAGMACLEKSFISLQCSSALAPFQVPCSCARLIQPLSIYPPIVSANNRALHIYSIFHLGACHTASMRGSSSETARRGSVSLTWARHPTPWSVTGACSWPICLGVLQKC